MSNKEYKIPVIEKLTIPRAETSIGGIELRLRRTAEIISIRANYQNWYVLYKKL